MHSVVSKLQRNIIAIVLSVCLLSSSSAYATFPGGNGMINAITSDCTGTPTVSQRLFDNTLSNPSTLDFVSNDGDTPLTKKLSWSPDGQRFIFPSVFQFYVGIANSDGSGIGPYGAKKLGVYPANADTVTWLPDNLTVGLGSYGGLQTYKFGDSTSYPRLVTWNYDGFDDITWSPKGTSLAFVKTLTGEPLHDQIGIIDADGSSETLVPKTPSNSDDQTPDWSPDGTKIAFASNRAQPETTNYDLYKMDSDGTNVTRFTNNSPYHYSNPVWSPDGTKLLAIRSNGTASALVLLDSSTGSELTTYVSPCGYGFSGIGWQPLGLSKIYRLANWRTHERLFTMDRNEAIGIPSDTSGWVLEDAAFSVYPSSDPGVIPIYRLANWKTHERLFTASAAERDYAVTHYDGWVSEGVAFYAKLNPEASSMPVYRLANWKTHERLFTTSVGERNYAVAHYDGWVSEGIAFYVPNN